MAKLSLWLIFKAVLSMILRMKVTIFLPLC